MKNHSTSNVTAANVQSEGIPELYGNSANETRAEVVSTGEAENTVCVKPKKSHKKPAPKKLFLLLCDPQCDYLEHGSMPIPSADIDAARTAHMIKSHLLKISEVYVALNARHRTHISNPISWLNSKGETPPPYTVITKLDVIRKVYRARVPTLQKSFLEYVTSLESRGRDALVLWPDHCLVGTEGHAVMPEIHEALQEWAGRNMSTVEYIIKGTNCATEM